MQLLIASTITIKYQISFTFMMWRPFPFWVKPGQGACLFDKITTKKIHLPAVHPSWTENGRA